MKRQFIIIALIFSAIATQPLMAAWPIPKVSKSSKSAKSDDSKASKDTVVSVDKQKINFKKIAKDAKKMEGIFTTYLSKEGVLHLEITDSVLNNNYLLANRISETSNTQDYVAGQMAKRPFIISFSKNETHVFMHLVQTDSYVDPNDPIALAFNRNFTNPIIKSFKIDAKNGDIPVIDVSSFFNSNEKIITPLKPENPLAKLFGGEKVLKGTFVKENSYINGVKVFPNNIEIKSVLSFTTDKDPYTVLVNRSIAVLPKDVMRFRLQDNRVGVFNSDLYEYTSNKDKMQSHIIINRWRIEPKEEDLDKYFAGELVEPKKPIKFYIDNAFPEKWYKAVKQGVEDWNAAFAVAGFKNVISAERYPINDPNFDPDDIRYSCIRYVTNPTANAMGPSYVDPRSGEIFAADVIWYHNIVSLLHNWRFTQTAAVDARVRKEVIDDEVMFESMRYVAAHEVGHTLGLMHNMGSSKTFAVDSLRSPSFTKQYGTTPSIMDYARFNFIAQPGDFEKGVHLTPPVLGVYDTYAINWIYRIIKDAKTSFEEKPTLNKWIEEKSDNPYYIFGAQQLMGTIDPTAQAEDLGDDHIKAGNYAISNLKIIMANYMDWLVKSGDNYEEMKVIHNDIVKQYQRHVRHVMPYIGGVNFREIRQGDKDQVAKKYVSKKDQQIAVDWLLDQARTYKSWVITNDIAEKLELAPNSQDALMVSIIGSLFNSGSLHRIYEGEMLDSKQNYKLYDYVDETIGKVFAASTKGGNLNSTEMTLQAATIIMITKYSGLNKAAASSSTKKIALDPIAEYENLMSPANDPVIPCSHAACNHSHELEDATSFYRLNFGLPTLPSYLAAPLFTTQLIRIQNIYKSNLAKVTGQTKSFYQYHIMEIDKLLKNN